MNAVAEAITNVADRLKDRDIYILIDKSGSMLATDTSNKLTRFKYAEESTIAIATLCGKYDTDGVTVIPFNGGFKVYDNVGPSRVVDVFAENDPMGGTMLAAPLQHVFDSYLDAKAKGTAKKNGILIVVITDGQPSDEDAVMTGIANFTKKLTNFDGEVGISLLQVGHDPSATAFLQKCDDELVAKYGAAGDIVDTKHIDLVESMGLAEVLVAALDD